MYGAVDFYNACRDAGITPIIGCEVYVCRNRFEKSGAAREYSHLILLCENNTGYQNLIKLVSRRASPRAFIISRASTTNC